MWFIPVLITTVCWGAADLFYKMGADGKDFFSSSRTVIAVGTVMGLYGIVYMLLFGIKFDPFDIIRYLPVSLLYILSMFLGYAGLKYIELSVSSPLQNSSGAVTAILCMFILRQMPSYLELAGIIIISVSIVAMAHLNREPIPQNTERKYITGIRAISFPILYCILDGLGTFADAVYLNEENPLITEDGALLAYEFTFFILAILVAIYMFGIKREKPIWTYGRKRIAAALFETVGQVSYVSVIGARAIIAAPVIASYCIVSVILSAIFLKEKLNTKKYIVIIAAIIGIIILGISDGLSGSF